jgi:hypothetical protein
MTYDVPWRRATRGLLVVLMATALMLTARSAYAAVSGPCDGSVTIDGVRYTSANDSPSNPIIIPDKLGLVASWEGSTTTPITDHTGDIGVVVGPATIVLETWGGPNAEKATSSSGDYSVDEARAQLPVDLVGLYELTGHHVGTGGACQGSVMILIEGNPLATPAGAGAGVGTLLAATGVVLAGRRRNA